MTKDEALTAMIHDAMPFAALLGIDVVEGARERVVAVAQWAPERCTSAGRLHGGYLMAVSDSTGSTCAYLNLPSEADGMTTIESKTNFFGGVRSGSITVTAEPVHVGRSTIVVQTDTHDDDGKLISRSLQTQAVLYPHAGRG